MWKLNCAWDLFVLRNAHAIEHETWVIPNHVVSAKKSRPRSAGFHNISNSLSGFLFAFTTYEPASICLIFKSSWWWVDASTPYGESSFNFWLFLSIDLFGLQLMFHMFHVQDQKNVRDETFPSDEMTNWFKLKWRDYILMLLMPQRRLVKPQKCAWLSRASLWSFCCFWMLHIHQKCCQLRQNAVLLQLNWNSERVKA